MNDPSHAPGTIGRLLVANRGEIAVRIAATARRMGIDTVGVYSGSDAGAHHLDSVDVAVRLGSGGGVAAYLDMERILAVAASTGSDAVHPGYGFLAENAEFARRVVDAGLIWVGPRPEQILLLGDKPAAKAAAAEAGVPTVPAVMVTPGGEMPDVEFPVLVKAAAGGGGRGMRVVTVPDQLAEAVESASREARAAFGDGSVFLEPYLESARHIEVQIIGDSHGNVIHLGDRDCSVQRRNQKVIEEAPAPALDPGIRRRLHEGALALARHTGYENAGTVEFLVAADGRIDFLEVNTRLQVEHPVTEAVTGLDLVELQLRVARGEALPLSQADVDLEGHAIEARIVAEDPTSGWMPSAGRLDGFELSTGPGVRVDTGYVEGSEVSGEFDSLLAKVITHGPDRETALGLMRRSLRTSVVAGVATDLGTLARICDEPDFRAGGVTTAYLAEHPEVSVPGDGLSPDSVALLLGAVFAVQGENRRRDGVTGFAPSGWRNLRTVGRRGVWYDSSGREHRVEYVIEAGGAARVRLGPWPEPGPDGALPTDERAEMQVRIAEQTAAGMVLEVDGRRQEIRTRVDMAGSSVDGATVTTRSSTGAEVWTLAPRFTEHRAEEAGSGPVSPLPGTVIAVHVEEGQEVDEGQLLVVVEAMKMEHRITAAAASRVARLHFAVGDRVDTGELLVTLEALESGGTAGGGESS